MKKILFAFQNDHLLLLNVHENSHGQWYLSLSWRRNDITRLTHKHSKLGLTGHVSLLEQSNMSHILDRQALMHLKRSST